MGGTPYNQQPRYQQPGYQAPSQVASAYSQGPIPDDGGINGKWPGNPGYEEAKAALERAQYNRQGPQPQDPGWGTGAGNSASIPLPHNQPEFSAATYRLFRAIADERNQPGNSARYEDYANRAFENPLPGSDPAGVGTDAYGNKRWDYSRGPGQLTGSQYGDNTGMYNRGDTTHPGGLSRTLMDDGRLHVGNLPPLPFLQPAPFSVLTGEGYLQAPGPHPMIGPGDPGSSQSTAVLGGRQGPPGATTLYPPNSIRGTNIGPRPSRPTGGAIPSRIAGTPRVR